MSEKPLTPIEIGLTAAIVAIEGNEPLILTASGSDGDKLAGLPFGPFDAVSHRTFEIGLRAWVEEQAGLRLGYVEQLYTFGDRGRHTQAGDTDAHVASIGYLALARAADNASPAPGATFEPWYRFFPWEDWREARPAMIERDILPELTRWAAGSEQPETARALSRKDRVRLYFGTEGAQWDEERVLDRYELLYEAGLIEEARRDGRAAADAAGHVGCEPLAGGPGDLDPEAGAEPRRRRRVAVARLVGVLREVGAGPGDGVADVAHSQIIGRWTPARPDRRPGPDGSAPTLSGVERSILAGAGPAGLSRYALGHCGRAGAASWRIAATPSAPWQSRRGRRAPHHDVMSPPVVRAWRDTGRIRPRRAPGRAVARARSRSRERPRTRWRPRSRRGPSR